MSGFNFERIRAILVPRHLGPGDGYYQCQPLTPLDSDLESPWTFMKFAG
jgi:hypothetical protein